MNYKIRNMGPDSVEVLLVEDNSTDAELAKVNGIEALQAIKADPHTRAKIWAFIGYCLINFLHKIFV
jgi:hypothetical protein